jgi:protein involved in polysaccharide export with SLBB domain
MRPLTNRKPAELRKQRHWLRGAIHLGLFGGWLAGTSVMAQTSVAGENAPGLSPGDPVRVKVWREPELSGDFVVTPEGTLDHPRFDTVQVVGVPLQVARARLRAFLSREYTDPLIILEPMLRVAVQGEVRQPSLYPMGRSTTVGQAIAIAGGPTERGKLNEVRLVRGTEQLRLDLTKPNSSDASMVVRSGDQLYVGRRGGSFFRDVLTPFASLTAAFVSVIVAVRQ